MQSFNQQQNHSSIASVSQALNRVTYISLHIRHSVLSRTAGKNVMGSMPETVLSPFKYWINCVLFREHNSSSVLFE